MWRCVVALAHADGIVKQQEREYLNQTFSNMPLSDAQYQTLVEDMSTPQNINDFFKYIEKPEHRAQMIYFARILAFKDGEFHPNEKMLMEKLNIKVTEEIDIDKIRADVKLYIEGKMYKHGEHLITLKDQDGHSHLFGTFMDWLGLDKEVK